MCDKYIHHFDWTDLLQKNNKSVMYIQPAAEQQQEFKQI